MRKNDNSESARREQIEGGWPQVDSLVMPSKRQIDDMRHMLGMTGSARKGQWGYRNHYAASHGNTKVLESMAQLVAMGLVEKGAATLTMQYFHCTRKGCEVAGLGKAGIKRVFGA